MGSVIPIRRVPFIDVTNSSSSKWERSLCYSLILTFIFFIVICCCYLKMFGVKGLWRWPSYSSACNICKLYHIILSAIAMPFCGDIGWCHSSVELNKDFVLEETVMESFGIFSCTVSSLKLILWSTRRCEPSAYVHQRSAVEANFC